MTEFEKLFSEKQEFIFRFLMKMTHDSSLAEELTQETFFRAYINFASLKNKEKASAWLCSIAKNAYFARYNEQKKFEPFEDSGIFISGENPEEAFIRKELSEKALLCLRELEEPYREVFSLSVFGGFSHKEISALFGKSESWARVTFYRAKQKLVEKMR